MKKLFNLSFKAKIIGLVLAVTAVLGVSSFANFNFFAKKTEREGLSAFIAYPRVLSDKVSAQFFERYGDVQAFAVNDAIQSLEPRRISEALDKYVPLYGLYDLIIVTDRNGNFVASNTKGVDGKEVNVKKLSDHNYKNEVWFQSVINEKFTEDKSKGFSGTYFEELRQDELMALAFGQKKPMSGFSAAIKNSKGEFLGVISNRAGSRWFERDFISNYAEFELMNKPSVRFQVFNKEGLLLLDYRPQTYGEKKNEIVHDENVLLKQDVKSEDYYDKVASGVKQWSGYTINAESNKEERIGYSKIFGDKWIDEIGWTVVVAQDKNEAQASINEAMTLFYVIFGSVLFLALVVSVWFGVLMAKTVEGIISQLVKNSGEVSNASESMASQSTELSEASTEQAAALQETVAAIDEISAMVEKNTDAATRSQDVSANSRNSATKGKDAVEEMLRAIEEINQSNLEITGQVNENEKQMNDITQLIKNISQKTKVIDEIVFQTKLLSFNASVEAARAGEAGKGFAVVAEEVGNLAQMSGLAAKEINQMLDQSVQKVDHMVRETQSHFSRIVQSSQQKVQTGHRTAQDCNAVLEEIIENVTSVDTLVSEIAVASKEQSQGIREISKAIGQMEQVTQQNTTVAQASSNEAEALSQRSSELNKIVGDLTIWMKGTQAPQSLPAASENHHQVVSFKKKPSQVSPPATTFRTEAKFKKTAGSDLVPSGDDPGFNE